ADPAAQQQLAAKLARLALPTPGAAAFAPASLASAAASANPDLAKAITGKRYVLAKNALGFEAIALLPPDSADAGGTALTVRIGGVDQRLVLGAGAWRKGVLASAPGAPSDAIAASGAWTSADTYTAKIARYNTPFVTTLRLKFSGDTLELTAEPNVGGGPARPVPIAGKVE
ncbi:MAG: hypothetical protein RLZZ15_3940, partial [Verrucomicrobiota bacterium]